jgi:microcystin-dependent protein
LGESAGVAAVTLTASQLPAHNHSTNANSANGNDYGPLNVYWAQDVAGATEYAASANNTMSSAAIANTGGGQPHNNIQPTLVLNFCIALQGVFPSRS